jgi:hypothetical protein
MLVSLHWKLTDEFLFNAALWIVSIFTNTGVRRTKIQQKVDMAVAFRCDVI